MLEIDLARGKPLPEWATDVPDLSADEAWILSAFWDLSTERQRSGWGLGPIPWSKIVSYATVAGLDREAMAVVLRVVQELDVAYMEWFEEESKPTKTKGDDQEDGDG